MEYYEIIADIVGFKGKFIHDLSKPEGMNRKLCSVKKQNDLGWKPKHTLTEGLQKTYNFYLENYEI
jgi:GDP-L-fucose synthase